MTKRTKKPSAKEEATVPEPEKMPPGVPVSAAAPASDLDPLPDDDPFWSDDRWNKANRVIDQVEGEHRQRAAEEAKALEQAAEPSAKETPAERKPEPPPPTVAAPAKVAEGRDGKFAAGWTAALAKVDAELAAAQARCGDGGGLNHKHVKRLRAKVAALQL